MPIFKPGSIARVPFPYADSATRQYRPAVVVATDLGPDGTILWVVMVTSAENRRWSGDVSPEQDHALMGLPVPSLARTAKIATIEAVDAEWRGDIGDTHLAAIRDQLRQHLQLM